MEQERKTGALRLIAPAKKVKSPAWGWALRSLQQVIRGIRSSDLGHCQVAIASTTFTTSGLSRRGSVRQDAVLRQRGPLPVWAMTCNLFGHAAKQQLVACPCGLMPVWMAELACPSELLSLQMAKSGLSGWSSDRLLDKVWPVRMKHCQCVLLGAELDKRSYVRVITVQFQLNTNHICHSN